MPKDNRRNTSVQTANREFGFSTADRVRFVTEYVLSKVFYLWREVKTPRLRLFVYEIVYSLRQAVGRDPLAMRWLRIDRVETVFGTFNVRPGTGDVACASPAFERSDLNHFLALLEEPLIAGRSVLFLDIGAALGTYSVAVGNRLNGLGDIRVLAFEPSRSSFALLKRNLEDNGLAGVVEARQLALGDGSASSATLRFDPVIPGGSLLGGVPSAGTVYEEVALSSIDAEIENEVFDVLAIKMDVEGSEVPVLLGATKALGSSPEALLIVEDFIDTGVVDYLQDTGWQFNTKLSPYNSFWSLQKEDHPTEGHLGVSA